MPLIDTLGADLAALHFAQIEGLNAQAGRIAAAEQLAQHLQGCGINAQAHGRLHADGTVRIHIIALADAPRTISALEKIDIIETADMPAPSGGLLCFAGDIPVFAYPPIASPAATS